MPIGSLRTLIFAAGMVLTGCAAPLVSDETEFMAVMPAPSTSNEEIAGAIQDLIRTYPVCAQLRALRLIGRPAVDFNSRPGKARLEDDAETDLDVLVRLGYLTKTALPELGERVFKYERTERGQDPSVIGTRSVCLPAERVLVSVTSVEREIETRAQLSIDQEPRAPADRIGHLAVRFTHATDPNSMWAHEPALIKLLAGDRATLPAGPTEGRTRLSRVWIRGAHPLRGAPDSGTLWALSWDAAHNRYEGGRWGGMSLGLWQLD